MSNAHEIFQAAYNGQTNFMTPDVISCRIHNGLAVEISQGHGFDRKRIFGVTVLETDGTKRPDLNKLFFSQAKAEAYVETL